MSDFFTEASSAPQGAPQPHKVGAGRGWQWIVEAYRIVRGQWLMWISFGLVLVLLHLLGKLIPFGPFLTVFISPVLTGGLMLAAQKGSAGEELELADLFAGFTRFRNPLFVLGGAYLLFIVLMALAMVLAGFSIGMTGHTTNITPGSAGTMLLASLLLLVTGTVFGLCAWLAPALVVLSGLAPLAALRMSLKAGLQNWLALTVCGVMLLILLVLALIPFGLGLLLWLPVAHLVSYTAWRDIFTPGGFVPRADIIVG